MRSHHPVSHLPVTFPAGNDDIAAMHPHPHVQSRNEERETVVAVLAAQFAVYPDPLAHGNPAGELYVPVAPFRVFWECIARLQEQLTYPFPSHGLCQGILRTLLHGKPAGIRLCIYGRPM